MLKKVFKTFASREEKDALQREFERAANRTISVETENGVGFSAISYDEWSLIPAIIKGSGLMRIKRKVGNVMILEFKTNSGFTMALHTHIKDGFEFETIVTSEGSVVLETEGVEITINKGDIDVIDAQRPHSAIMKPGSTGYIIFTKK